MPSDINLRGSSHFRDGDDGDELANTLGIVVDLNRAQLLVGRPGETDMEALHFHEPAVRRALTELVSAMRRRAYRRRPIRPVPKPVRLRCELCEGRREIRNPYSGEVFPCPGCRG